ncbi:DUF3562 domain-containing protein [Noviherbaspirillum malthae]|uniref:DUF3562 domain-containing protein n=1 Tax=Noviherbaspirillum malthae TaxID=1260987 RepID=UPI001E55A10C|nr:DUF3562 domain-containing protein [Noviherbaspirillum malthae]
MMHASTDITEHAKHKRYVELLAEETHRPIEQVELVYGNILSHLKETAEISDYVPVFAWRRARALLVHH